jgi:protein-tyrosine phosphatase
VLDLHNHVLFGLDDGCRAPAESSALAQAAKAAGHSGFVATPHIRPGMFDNTVDGIKRRRDETRPLVEAEGLELFLGAEYFFSPELLEAARNKQVLTLGESSRYVLAEFPQDSLPMRWEQVLFEIRLAGYVAVIAHPERCTGVQKDLDDVLERLTRAGALLQLDAGSLIGHYGREAKKASHHLVKRGAYHVAACDLHRPTDVNAIVAKSMSELSSLLGKRKKQDELTTLIEVNPRKILSDAPPDTIGSV